MNEAKTNLTLKQRRRLQGSTQSDPKAEKQTNGKELSRIVAILVMLLAFGAGTALGMIYFRPDPRLEEIDDMMAIANDPYTPNDVRSALWGETGQVADELPANLRRGRGRRGGDPEERDMQRAPKFLALTAAQQLAKLQEQADREKEWADRMAERMAEMQKDAADKPADASQSSQSNKNRGGRHGRSDDQRVQRQEQRLANHPPQQRAQLGLYRQMMNAVRQTASH